MRHAFSLATISISYCDDKYFAELKFCIVFSAILFFPCARTALTESIAEILTSRGIHERDRIQLEYVERLAFHSFIPGNFAMVKGQNFHFQQTSVACPQLAWFLHKGNKVYTCSNYVLSVTAESKAHFAIMYLRAPLTMLFISFIQIFYIIRNQNYSSFFTLSSSIGNMSRYEPLLFTLFSQFWIMSLIIVNSLNLNQ